MLSIATLKNIQLQDYRLFFREFNVARRIKRLEADSRQMRYSKVQQIIKEELSSTNGSFPERGFDNFLYNHLFYTNLNYHFVYRYNNFFGTSETSVDNAVAHLTSSNIQYNTLLVNDLNDQDPDQFQICSTRITSNQGRLRQVNLLLKIGEIRTIRDPKINVFCGVQIDVVNGFVVFRFNQRQLEILQYEPLKLLGDLKLALNGQGRNGRRFEPLHLNIVSLNETTARKAIYGLFEELSLEAENILEEHAKENTTELIVNFLEEMQMNEVKEDYIEQIKAVIYQDISTTIADSDFERGWVFRFLFKEGENTRAASRTDNYGPIYGSKVYWHLKELIFKEKELYEGGFHWYTNNAGNLDEFVQVRIESRNDTMILHYYYKMRNERREKEDFVLRKINAFLP